MSNFLSIAAVTATLRASLSGPVAEAVAGASVTTGPPPQKLDPLVPPRTNLYLYQVIPNANLRNLDLPTRAPGGRLHQAPVAAYDLHYLLSFYGDALLWQPQIMMGRVLAELHAHPFLDLEMAARVSGQRDEPESEDPLSQPLLQSADLYAHDEPIVLSPMSFSIEEISKIWSYLFNAPYTLSAAWKVSSVLIDAAPAPPRRPSPTQVVPNVSPILSVSVDASVEDV